MPGTDGLQICTKIREQSNVPIIIVSARDSEIDRITGITLGSDDYLTKPFSPMELVVRVKAIFRRIRPEPALNSQETLSAGNVTLRPSLRKAECKGVPMELSPTEFALMAYMFENRNRAVSREELLKNVWKFDFEVDTRATDDVIKRLRKKLSSAGATVSIESVWGFGFKMETGEIEA
jgi:DNA-binding response OmpR family regulator